ncbi:MAG: hypothetical protein ACLR13_03850 [Acutalibacteraceae bacterium]
MHQYIQQTFDKGVVALTQEHTFMEDSAIVGFMWRNARCTAAIATVYRNQFQVPVVSVTGSVGKTSTREMIALALSAEKM